MIPFKDDNPVYTVPYVTYGLIALNVLAYLWELIAPQGAEWITHSYGAIPHNIVALTGAQSLGPVSSIFTSMFLHGGILHLAGNMLYLWIFGDNIEDRLGHIRFVVFYLLSGIAAAYAHALSDPGSLTPMIGASGAISGVLGAYLLLFPRARVHVLFFFGFFWQVILVPALIVIGFWAIIQLVNGIITKGFAGHGGVAWFAHLGGFVFGLATIKVWLPRRRLRQWS